MTAYSPKIQSKAPFPTRSIVALLVAFTICNFIGLGHPPLIDPDEPVYGETGRLMAVSHSFAAWWTPHYNGGMWFDKPPVTYWLVGLSMRLFGTGDFAARLPMALATVALVWVVARLAWRLYPVSKYTPVWAALVFGTCAQTLMLSRSCVTDMLLALCLTAALLGAWRWLVTGDWLPALGAGAAVGVGTLVKGPVAIVLIGGQILLYLLVSRQWRRLASARIWAALLLALVIAAPWYWSMYRLHGQFFLRSFLEAQNVTRYVKAEHAANSGLLFFVPVLCLALLPWTFAFFPALVTACRRTKEQLAAMRGARDVSPATLHAESPDLFALLWVGLVFVFFSASQTKLITYIYPLYPLVACFVGYWVAEVSRRVSSGLLAVAMLIVVYAGYVGAGLFLRQRGTDVALGIAVMVIAAAWALVSKYAESNELLAGRAHTLRLAVPAFALALLMPIAAESRYWLNPDPKNISAVRAAQIADQAAQPGAPLYCLVFNKPSVVYYSHRAVVFTDSRKEVARWLAANPRVVCITKPDVLDDMSRRGILPPITVLSIVVGKAVVITGQPGG